MSLWAYACDCQSVAARRFPRCGGLSANICGNDTEEISLFLIYGVESLRLHWPLVCGQVSHDPWWIWGVIEPMGINICNGCLSNILWFSATVLSISLRDPFSCHFNREY